MPDYVNDGARDGGDRRAYVYALAAATSADAERGVVGSLGQLSRAVVQETSVLGAAVSLMPGVGSEGVVAGSDERSIRVAESQFTLGEGPCYDAHAERRPVLSPDLSATGRWPLYSGAALREGVVASFALPLGIGAVGLGVLDLYADRAGSLADDHLVLALTFAEVATEMLLDGYEATPGEQVDVGLERALDYRSEIYQAQGMVMIQLGSSLAAALARMRAHAFAAEIDLADLAAEIVAGRIRLDPDD